MGVTRAMLNNGVGGVSFHDLEMFDGNDRQNQRCVGDRKQLPRGREG